MKNLRAGLIGLGAISSLHADAIRQTEGVVLHSACDVNRKLLGDFCRLNADRGFVDYRDLFNDGVDVAVVCLPHYLHYKAGMTALEKGCHLVMEKPFAVSMKECRDLQEAAGRKDVKIMIADSAYYEPKIRKAREIVQSGKMGSFISGACINYKDFYFGPERPAWFLDPKKSGGGQLMNVGVHRIAATRAVLGKKETEVKASVVNPDKKKYRVDAHGTVFIRYAGGAAFILEDLGYYKASPDMERCFHFNFENGIINLSGKLNVVHKDGRTEYPEMPGEGLNPYQLHYRELVRAIEENREPYPGAVEGMRDVMVILAAYESARTGREVRLNTAGWKI